MRKVLVVEDEVQTRRIFLKCLEFEGFQAFGASNGLSGMRLAQSQHPDLIVCDIMMPDMDGYSVLAALRRSPGTASIPLIFLTAKVTMADLRRGMELGADDYLTKPCTVEQFLAAIHSRLKRHEELSRLYGQVAAPHPLESHLPDSLPLEPSSPDESLPGGFFPDSPNLEAVFHYIEANYCQPINLSDVAQAAGYSPAYLTNLVQSQTGRSVKRWIIERRMAHARNLLLNTTQSVRQISEAAGYSDAGYFTRQFRQLNGMSPQVWRQQSVANLTDSA
ncbi:response regulator [filamentous cyanobacterium LEGE 11480]|uniref:Response regulator n=1 Tax=Romeriopsis navalis LEGE 11480 TaxID=2777977 RepID=A0A928VQ78_9CYAN|nr:response regulator [Romeriopsis navalis]MBE9032758.1 response regulator [Romeriopsis navalis LEGE 11480]